MSQDMHAMTRAQIDDHFGGDSAPQREAKMRAHLGDCDPCRRYYERHMLLSELDPQATPWTERLGRPMGLRPVRRRAFFALGALVPAAAALFFLVRMSPSPKGDGEFVARGGASASEVMVYRFLGAKAPQPIKGEISRSDELAFTYRNPTGKQRLLVFGVDEHRHVYWYHPAFTDPASDPTAIAIASSSDPRELTEAVHHDLDGTRLSIYGLFTDRLVTVKEVESVLARSATPAFEGAELSLTELKVLP